MLNIAVFFGGKSNEHEISVITGMLAVNLLRNENYKVLPVYLPVSGGMQLALKACGVNEFSKGSDFPEVVFTYGGIAYAKKPKKKISIDCALNCCHGGAGEDGTLSALLSWYGIQNASPAMAPSAVFMDKALSKIAAKGLDIPVANSFTLTDKNWESELPKKLKFPLVVKPCSLGSSIGISVAKDREELLKALQLAFRLDSRVLAEEYLKDKRDLNCAARRINGEIVLSPIEEVFSQGQFLSFGEKYEGTSERNSKIPAEITEDEEKEIRHILTEIYSAFDLSGVVRADFILSEGNVYFNELNTVPGSLSCYLFGETLTDAKNHLVALIQEALNTAKPQKETLWTGILNSNVFTGGKACKRR